MHHQKYIPLIVFLVWVFASFELPFIKANFNYHFLNYFYSDHHWIKIGETTDGMHYLDLKKLEVHAFINNSEKKYLRFWSKKESEKLQHNSIIDIYYDELHTMILLDCETNKFIPDQVLHFKEQKKVNESQMNWKPHSSDNWLDIGEKGSIIKKMAGYLCSIKAL